MEKKNTGLIVLIVILCLLVGGLTGYIIGNKIFDKITDNKNNGIVENNDDNKSNIVNYSFGDEVIISKMSMVKNFVPGEDSIDLSKWHVLSDKDNIVTLYSDAI